ncbi:MAG TPA: TonB family protein [Blastocatellia bacterium]|nr:TonB family protein [Blastocatellia bacterium]
MKSNRSSRISLSLALSLASLAGVGSVAAQTARNNNAPRPGNVNYDAARVMALQPDGKIVVAGVTRGNGSRDDFALARFSADGSLDSSFGEGGRVVTDFAGNSDSVRAVALQPDGKILLVGTTDWDDCDSDFALARYNSNGASDTSFGQNGKVVTDFLGRDKASAVAILDDGRIIVTGTATDARRHIVVARYTANGKLDSSFGWDGKAVTPSNTFPCSISLRPDGVISVTGAASFCSKSNSRDNSIVVYTLFARARFNSNGSPDPSLAGRGIATAQLRDAGAIATALAIQPDGKSIMLGDNGFDGRWGSFFLQRLNEDGKLDDSFGQNGKVITSLDQPTEARAIGLLPDGSFVVAGSAKRSIPEMSKAFALARYSKDGELDAGFGKEGKVITPCDGYVEALAVTVQPDGKILAGGYLETGGLGDFLLMRYDRAGALDSAFGSDGRVYADFNGVTDTAPATGLKRSRKPSGAQKPGCSEIQGMFVTPVFAARRETLGLIPVSEVKIVLKLHVPPDVKHPSGPGSSDDEPSSGSGNINPDGSAKSVDSKPVILKPVQPLYTEAARRNKVSGVVKLRALIGVDGRVKRAVVVEGLPDGLNERALEAAYKIIFKPAMKDGQPVAYWAPLIVTFNIR